MEFPRAPLLWGLVDEDFRPWRGPGRQWRPPPWSPLYGWPVPVSAEGTCRVGRVWGALPSVVCLGVVLVDCLEELWVAPSEALEGWYFAAASVAAQ